MLYPAWSTLPLLGDFFTPQAWPISENSYPAAKVGGGTSYAPPYTFKPTYVKILTYKQSFFHKKVVCKKVDRDWPKP